MADFPKPKAKPESVIRAKAFLIKAIGNNDIQTIERIFKAKYPVDEPVQAFSMTTPLMHCSALGQPEALETILALGPDPNAIDRTGRTAIHYACKGGNIQNLRILLEKGIFQQCIEA